MKYMNRNVLIGRIHQLKKQLLLDEETYRTVLMSISGKNSCKGIDLEYLNIIKQSLEGLLQRQRLGSSLKLTNAAEHRKIAKLGYLLGWSWPDIAGFCFKEVKKKSTQSCTAAELGKIINGMVNIINDKIADGSLTLPHSDLVSFLKYTQSHNRNITQSPNLSEAV